MDTTSMSEERIAEVFRALYKCRTRSVKLKRSRYRVMERMAWEFPELSLVNTSHRKYVSHGLFYKHILIVEEEE